MMNYSKEVPIGLTGKRYFKHLISRSVRILKIVYGVMYSLLQKRRKNRCTQVHFCLHSSHIIHVNNRMFNSQTKTFILMRTILTFSCCFPCYHGTYSSMVLTTLQAGTHGDKCIRDKPWRLCLFHKKAIVDVTVTERENDLT